MRRKRLIIFLMLTGMFLISKQVQSQNKPTSWNLKTCIDYAKQQNIQLKQAQLTIEGNQATLQQSKEALYPNLSASSSLSMSGGKKQNSTTGGFDYVTTTNNSYSLNARVTLFDGLSSYKTIKQNDLQTNVSELNYKETENNIIISITQAYLELLYAKDNLDMAQKTVETSKAQLALSENLLNAEHIAKVDYIQVKAQYNSDLYSVVTAQNTLDSRKLTMKQLLELGIDDNFDIEMPTINDEDVLKPLPSLSEVYQTAYNSMPEIKSSDLNTQVASISLDKANAAYLPTLSMSGSLTTGYAAGGGSYTDQLLNLNIGQGVVLSLSVPIYSNGSTKTAVQKAKLNLESAKLDFKTTQKDLLKTIESLYQDAVSSQSNYVAANVQVTSSEESYKLVQEQYALGMKNTVDLLTEKDNLLKAQKALLQAKYGAILSQKLLNFYQGVPIEL
jgi:outer membrane protein